MAYFRKRGCKWSFSIEIGRDDKGNRKQKTVSGFPTKKAAIEAAFEIQKDLNDDVYVRDEDTTFESFSDNFIKNYAQNVKPASVRIRKHELCLLLKFFKEKRIKDITPALYENVLFALKEDGYSISTISGIHGTARMIFKKALQFQKIKRDPTEFVRPPREQMSVDHEDLPKYMEKEELAHFLKTAQEQGFDNDYVMFSVLSYTGIRAGELCALKWSDINMANCTLNINKTYYNPSNNILEYVLGPPKTKASKRTIEIDMRIIQLLQQHKKTQDEFICKCKNQYKNENFVFSTIKYPGYPVYVKFVGIRMKRLIMLSGLSKSLTPHSLRHTHASLLAEAGASLEEIMERLGQVDDDTTRKVYLHITKEMKKATSQKFSKLMEGLL